MPERATLLPRDGAPRRERAAVAAALLVALVGWCAAAALVRGAAPRGAGTVLFQNPSTPADDADSWTIQGILDDGIDGDSGSDPFKLDVAAAEREARRKARLGLRQVGSQRTTMLLGGDDWLGAPLAVPEDVRENGEQRIGEEVTYWNTHSGQIGTGSSGYPYARARRGQMLLLAPDRAQTQALRRLSADEANAQVLVLPGAARCSACARVEQRTPVPPQALRRGVPGSPPFPCSRPFVQMDDMFDDIATSEEVNRYAERGIDISGAAQAHRAGGGGEAGSW
jgi:hypothetical protein